MDNLNFIKKFSKINIQKIAKENNISSSNLYAGRCSSKKVLIMRKAIEAAIAKLYINDYEEIIKDGK